MLSLSQHFKNKLEVHIENDKISTDLAYEERNKLQDDNFHLNKCVDLHKKTLENILGLVGSAAQVFECEKADNSHVIDPVSILSKVISMVDHASTGTDGDAGMNDFVRFKDRFDSLLSNIQEICHKRQPIMNSASSDCTAAQAPGLIDSLDDVISQMDQILNKTGNSHFCHIMDLLNAFKCELNDVLKKKDLFTTEVMNLLTHVFNMEILKNKKLDENEALKKMRHELKIIETKKHTQKKTVIENMRKNINKEEMLLKKLNVDIDNEISEAMLKHNALLAMIPGRPYTASTDSGLSMHSERGVHVSTQTHVKHYNNFEVQYSNVEVQTEFVYKPEATHTDDFASKPDGPSINENRPGKSAHDGTVGAALVQTKISGFAEQYGKKRDKGNKIRGAQQETALADNSRPTISMISGQGNRIQGPQQETAQTDNSRPTISGQGNIIQGAQSETYTLRPRVTRMSPRKGPSKSISGASTAALPKRWNHY